VRKISPAWPKRREIRKKTIRKLFSRSNQFQINSNLGLTKKLLRRISKKTMKNLLIVHWITLKTSSSHLTRNSLTKRKNISKKLLMTRTDSSTTLETQMSTKKLESNY
jgi:hypothetical protein